MFRIVLCRDIIGRMTTDSIRGSRSLRWNIYVPAREHQRSNGGTSMFQCGNISFPVAEQGA
nr:hypothetical protein [uncultured Prevotella sp.]